MRNAPRGRGYAWETVGEAAAGAEPRGAPQAGAEGDWHASRFDESPGTMMNPEAQMECTLSPIEDAWLDGVFEVQITDQGRVFSFLPPHELREAMALLVTTETLIPLLPR